MRTCRAPQLLGDDLADVEPYSLAMTLTLAGHRSEPRWSQQSPASRDASDHTVCVISEAHTDAERQEALDLFLRVFNDIEPNAVPMTEMDTLYAPLVAQYRDQQTGRLLGAALTCRAQVAVGSLMMARMGRQLSPEHDYTSVLDKHSQLDLMAVLPEARSHGIGGHLISYLEGALRQRGVRVWFGNATADLEVPLLRSFYSRHGFTVLDPGQPLPNLMGKQWLPEFGPDLAFHFYKQFTRRSESAPDAHDQR